MARTQRYESATYTNQAGWEYYIHITPAQSSSYVVSPTTGTTAIPDKTILADVVVEQSIDDFPLGMANPSICTISVNLDRLDRDSDADVQDLAKYLLNPAILIETINGNSVYVTNIVEVYTDYGTGTFQRVFVGAQKRTPSVEMAIGAGDTIVEIEFVHLAYYVLESSRTDEAYTWLQSKSYVSTPFAYNFLWGASPGTSAGTGYTATGDDSVLHMMELGDIRDAFIQHIEDLLQFLWRSAGATFDIEMPQDYISNGGVTYYKQNFSASTTRGAVIGAPNPLNDLYMIAYTSSSSDPSTTVADRNGGWAYYDGDKNGMFKYPNLWDLISDWAGAFYCQMCASHNTNTATKELLIVTDRLWRAVAFPGITLDADTCATSQVKIEMPIGALAETNAQLTDTTRLDIDVQSATVKRGTLNEADANVQMPMHNQMVYIDSSNPKEEIARRSFLRGRPEKVLIYYQNIYRDFTHLYYFVTTSIAADTPEDIAILPHPDVAVSDSTGTVYNTTNTFTAFPTPTTGGFDFTIDMYSHNDAIEAEVRERQTLGGHGLAVATAIQTEFGGQTQYGIEAVLKDADGASSEVALLLHPTALNNVAFDVDLSSLTGGRGYTSALGSQGKPIAISVNLETATAEVEVFVRNSTSTPT